MINTNSINGEDDYIERKEMFEIEESLLNVSKNDVIDGRLKIKWSIFIRVMLIHISTFQIFGPIITGFIVTLIYGKPYA